MPINFPNSPTTSQIHTESGLSWIWTGTVWDSLVNFQDVYLDLGNLSGSIVIDLSLASKFKFNQVGNITSFSYINEVIGRDYIFEITRETTNYTFSFASGKFRFPIGAAPIMTNPTTNGSSPAKAIDILTGLCITAGRLDIVITPDMINN